MNKSKIIKPLCLLLALLALPAAAQTVFRNSGNLYVGGTSTLPGLYIGGDFTATNATQVKHPGKTILTGHFYNNTTASASNVFTSDGRTGIFEFKGTAKQNITGTAAKATNYITFPNTVIINNTAATDPSVTIASSMGANMKTVTFTSGKLILDSDTVTSPANASQVAHLWLEDGASAIANTNAKANIQVNLALGNRTGRLVGFTPPFETMYADYFFFNFLSLPSQTELFKGNGSEIWNTNPRQALKAGTGYVIGQVLVPYSNSSYYTGRLDAQWSGALLADMIRTKFSFNRYGITGKSFGTFVTASDRFTGEKLINANVSVSLANGYNYLGNPFMVPLDLSALTTTSRTDWGLTGTTVKQQYYVLSPGATGYSADGSSFTFTATFLVGQTTGNTETNIAGAYGRSSIVAPMQMFVVKNEGAATTMTIPRSKRLHGTQQFLRSDDISDEPVDELLIETRDLTTGGFDRFCIVFRTDASMEATDVYDAEKLFNRSGGVNQTYTRSSDGKELTTNVITPQTRKLQMYFEPSLERQEVELEAFRLETLRSVYDVVIEDTKTGEKHAFAGNPVYRFTSSPGDSPARFVLHFSSDLATGMESIEGTKLAAWYKEGVVIIEGLKDIEGTLQLYNMQGQLLISEKITAPTMQIRKTLPDGIYLIRTKEKTVKLLVKN